MLGYYLPGHHNPILERVREIESKERAPFSGLPVLLDNSDVTLHRRPEIAPGGRLLTPRLGNVPILRIAGISIASALYRDDCPFVEGDTTFRDVLFNHLHGRSFTDKSVAYLLSDCVKHPDFAGYARFEQDEDISIRGTGSYARGGMEFSERNGWFFASNGQQRAIFAMYVVYQAQGECGVIKNVKITGYGA